jgi:Ribbon-helix-helix protein, copG family
MKKPKGKNGKAAIFALVEPSQKAELEALGRANERSVGFLVREAISQYLANLKKKP